MAPDAAGEQRESGQPEQESFRLGPTDANAWRVTGDLVDLARPAIPPRRCRLRARPQNVVLDLNRTGVVVVDMQNDFCARGGWFDLKGFDLEPVRRPIPTLSRLLPRLRRAGVTVFWVNWGNRRDIANLPPSVIHAGSPDGRQPAYGDPRPGDGEPILVAGAAGAAVVEELAVEPRDILINKTRFSGFQDSDFDGVLRNRQITTLLFTGINIDRCVFATLMDASFLGYDCLLVEDATSTPSPQFCTDAVLYLVEKLYGFVTTSAAIEAGLNELGAVES